MKLRHLFLLLCLSLAPAMAQRPALVPPVVRFSDSNGKPLAFGQLYSYTAGTTTPAPTYTDSTTGALNPNPTILDATGSASVFLGGNVYKFVLQNSAGAVQWTADNIAQSGFASTYVNSVFGRTGVVTAQTGDYHCAQITGAICSLPNLYNQTIQVAGGALPQEPILNFIPGVSGGIQTFTITAGGSGYTGAPSVTFTDGTCVSEPTGSSVVTSGAVTVGVIVTPGSGCTSAPTPNFSGGGGTGAAGVATLFPNGVSCIDSPGTTSTNCTITSGGGSGGGTSVVNDVTFSRTFGSISVNTNTVPLLVSISGYRGGGGCTISPYIGATNPPLLSYGMQSATPSGGPAASGSITFLVPPGYYYEATTDYCSLGSWVEATLPGGGIGGSGVSSLKVTGGSPLVGDLTISCDPAFTCTQSGSTIHIAPTIAFTINSFTGCGGSLELGATVTNPVCSATYSATPTSAQITNTDSIDSPLTLTTPFTSGTIVGSFHHTAVATVTVTLTAIGSSTQTATQQYTFNPRIFGGVGASGATSSVTASGTTAVLSTSDVLASAGLGAEAVGQVFGPYSPSSQAIYLLLTGGSHTFIDAGTGFPFAMNAPTTVTFTNANGVVMTLYLYQSTNPLAGTFSPKVAT